MTTDTPEDASAPVNLDELEALANAATPGHWHIRQHRGLSGFIQAPRLDPAHPYDIELLGEDETLYPTREADMRYIVGVQPQVLKKLLAELRQAREALLKANSL